MSQINMTFVAGVIPALEGNGGSVQQAEDDKGSRSGVSLGSDALSLPWYSGTSADMPMCCNIACMALAVLYRMKRYHAVVQVGVCMCRCCVLGVDTVGDQLPLTSFL